MNGFEAEEAVLVTGRMAQKVEIMIKRGNV